MAVVAKLKRKIQQFAGKGLLYLPPTAKNNYDIGFCMDVQVIPKNQIESLAFGKPEGIRVLIQSGANVISAADFLYAGEKLKLSYLHHGKGLALLVSTLNKLEKKYQRTRNIYRAELIYFLLSAGTYVLIKSKSTCHYYHAAPRKMTRISPEQLKRQVSEILIHRE